MGRLPGRVPSYPLHVLAQRTYIQFRIQFRMIPFSEIRMTQFSGADGFARFHFEKTGPFAQACSSFGRQIRTFDRFEEVSFWFLILNRDDDPRRSDIQYPGGCASWEERRTIPRRESKTRVVRVSRGRRGGRPSTRRFSVLSADVDLVLCRRRGIGIGIRIECRKPSL